MQTARVHSRFSACAVWYKIWIVRFFKETLQCASTDFSGTVRSNSRLYIPHVQSILYTSSLHMSADRIYLDAFVFMSLEGPRQAKHVFAHTKNLYRFIYSWLSLSRTRLSRITAYLKVKICSLPKNENLTTYKKYCGKEEKFSSGAISPLFHNIFNISLTSRVQLHIYLLNVVNQISFSSILQIWYVEVRLIRSISESLLGFEITRVDCIFIQRMHKVSFPSRKHTYIIFTPLNPTFI